MRRRLLLRPANGIVLLHTLVLLLIGSALAAVVLGLGLGRTRDSVANVTVMRLESAAESGVQDALYHLLQGATAQSKAPELVRRLTIDGFKVDVSTQFSDGLVGLRHAERRYLQGVLTAALGSRASVASTALTGRVGAVSSYAELGALEGIGPGGLACLLPHVTLYSDSTVPVAKHAPPELRKLLNLKDSENIGVIQSDGAELAGSIVRIWAQASSGEYRSRRLLVEAMLTGRRDRPVLVLEWYWMPVESSEGVECGFAG